MTTELAQNTNYYRYIFKKTEKIVASVFYILYTKKDESSKDRLIETIEETAIRLLKKVHGTLGASVSEASPDIATIRSLLIELESELRILSASGVLSADLLTIFVNEIDTVIRNTASYIPDSRFPLMSASEEMTVPARSTSTTRTSGSESARDTSEKQYRGEDNQYSRRQLPNRRGRILSVIREKGQTSIKDITEQVKDCSEKTIQRELATMVKDGIVERKGERRWSVYSLV